MATVATATAMATANFQEFSNDAWPNHRTRKHERRVITMASLEEITVTYVKERYRKESWGIHVVTSDDGPAKQFSMLGDSEPGEFSPRLSYRVFGSWDKTDPKWGPQFRFKSFVPATPHNRQGTIAYLQNAPHVGPVIAGLLYDRLGPKAVKILREQPDVAAAAVPRLTEEHAHEAAEWLERQKSTEDALIELTDLFHGRGFPKSSAREAIGMWGNRAHEVLKKDPYKAMAFRGIGFKKADAFYLDLGLPPGKLKRQAYSISYTAGTDSDSQGHTWITKERAIEQLRATIGAADVLPEKAITLARRGRLICVRTDADGREWIAQRGRAENERYVAEKIVEAMHDDQSFRSVVPWPSLNDLAFATLSSHQRECLAKSLQGPICIFGGAPGTGKTYTVARVVDAITRIHGASSVTICAPTGKAAVRCTQAMKSNGVEHVARTIHGLLGVQSAGDGGWTFVHGTGDPLPYRFIVVDESSMIPVPLLASLLAARARGTGLLLVGDVNQLPPVEYGAPLRDLIDVGLPYGELREIHRNAGTIVRACAAIRDGQPIPIDDRLDLEASPPRNLILVQSPKGIAPAKLIATVRNVRDKSPFDATWETQVCVAVNKRSSLSRIEINKLLQPELNGKSEPSQDCPFRVGDKVIQTKNQFLPAPGADKDDEDSRVFVANGEIGEVIEIDKSSLTVDFTTRGKEFDELPDDERKIVKIPRFKRRPQDDVGADSDADIGTGCDLELAYAVTTHKMQGSGVPVAIVVLDEYPGASGQFGVCDRAWLFTAISRAEKACILIGTEATMLAICSKRFIWRRKTFLRELIRELADKWQVELLRKKPETIESLF